MLVGGSRKHFALFVFLQETIILRSFDVKIENVLAKSQVSGLENVSVRT